jgi:Flp pilus assembly protein TadG
MVLNSIKRFARDKRGNFAIMTVFTFPMLIAGVALSVDISNNLRLKTDLQNANDTAVLFATRSFQETKSVPTKAEVQAFINGNLKSATSANVNVDFDTATNIMTLTSEATSKPMLMNYFGNQDTKVKVLSKAKLGVSGILEFALALDTTESMKFDGRMTALKVAAKDFIKLLFDKKDQGADVKGAIVPFAQYVNVGMSRRDLNWMNVPADIDTRVTKTVDVKRWRKIESTKRWVIPAGYWTAAKPATGPTCWLTDGYQQCNSGSPAEPSRWVQPAGEWQWDWESYMNPEKQTSGSYFTWKGCVSSRSHPDNVSDAFDGKKFPGVLNVDCTDELQPLTRIRGQLVSKIESLKPLQATYVPEGVMWGMRTLTPAEPFTEGSSPVAGSTQPLRKALIIMTDGQNTIRPVIDNNSLSGNKIVHNSITPVNNVVDSSVPDAYTLEACTAAKNAGIEVYTIGFGSDITPAVKTMLKSCASKPTFYNDAADSVGLTRAFNDIADNLLGVRLTQ